MSGRRRHQRYGQRDAARPRGPQKPAPVTPPPPPADVFQPSSAIPPPQPEPEPEAVPEESGATISPVDEARQSLWLLAKGWHGGFEDDDDLSALEAEGLVDDTGAFTELGQTVAEELDATTGGDDADDTQAVESTSTGDPEAEAAAEADGPAA